MKRNTGCGCNISGQQTCPPLPTCEVVHPVCVNVDTPVTFPAIGVPVPVVETPVPLVEILLEIDMEDKISLPTPARSIKHIEKNISLTQCKAVPGILFPDNIAKLYLTGFIHKNIQYVEQCSGVVKDFSVDVPFCATHRITLEVPPQFPLGFEYSLKNNVLQRRELAADGHGADRCTFGSLTFELYNEPIDCKLIASAVKQTDLLQDFDNFGRFQSMTEKTEVLLLFKLIQVQNVCAVTGCLPGPTPLGEESQPAQVTARDRFKQLIGRMNY